MVTTGAKFIVDSKGRKKAVLLNIGEYRRLMAHLEELEDALDLQKAIKTGGQYRDYTEIRAELHRTGRL